MRKFLAFLALFFFTGVLMAQGDGDSAAAVNSFWWSPATAMAIAAGVCGLAQGNAVSAACEAMGRNPAAANSIRTTMIIGLALIESLALYTLIVALVTG